MLKICMLVLLLGLLVGCTSKEEKALMKNYEKNKAYHKALQKTEKIQLYEDQVSKVLLIATYLHDAKAKNKEDEVFVLGFYAHSNASEGLDGGGFSLTLDGKKAKSMKVLQQDSVHLKHISFKSKWSHFYLVRFPHTKKKRFDLILESKAYGKGVLSFAKVAKYVFNVKAF